MNIMASCRHAPPITTEIPPRSLLGVKLRLNLNLSTQPGSTPSVQEFKPEGQTQDNNANKKTPWWEKIPGASRLFRQPSNNAIPAEFEQSNLSDDPSNFYIYPVCSMQQPYNPGTRTTLILNHCQSCTIISLELLISLLKIFTNVLLPSGR